MLEKIKQTTEFLSSKMTEMPKIGMITGTGLGSLTERTSVEIRVPYEQIPNFPKSTIEGHKGTLVVGKLANKSIIAMEGRFH
ncbi:MAG: purine-nucleoside phosphorylase, partial [Desulfobacteraceae bacterium]|nr:purine-nucleoside phosphorylase [Desulfobacteraceae bacterium]